MSDTPQPGSIGWHDLTCSHAESVRDFYATVVGWKPQPVEMEGYSDFSMTADGSPVAGVCHARGPNADIPPQWIMYVIVKDLDASLQNTRALGGEVVTGPKSMGRARYAIIKDPAGAVCGLYQS